MARPSAAAPAAALLAAALALAAAAPAAAQGPPADAAGLLAEGRYREAVAAYDAALAGDPDDAWALVMKGVALSNMGMHAESLKQFHRAQQAGAPGPAALIGLGVGFGSLGEYHESRRHLEAALAAYPGSAVARNYLDRVEAVLAKYPYEPTEKPAALTGGPVRAPEWTRQAAGWWAGGLVGDAEFARAVRYLAEAGAISAPGAGGPPPALPLPGWARDAAAAWAAGGGAGEFAEAVRHIAGHAHVGPGPERSAFAVYLARIEAAAAGETRYVEHPNPSVEVIKKFLRDYEKWDFEGEAGRPPSRFPDPAVSDAGGRRAVTYGVFVNEQPTGLPLDHVGTLRDSLAFWEGARLAAGGRAAAVSFEAPAPRESASVWVTWTVRDLGEGVLGHAHLGKGIVEVALGDYACDGSFQLYDVGTVRRVMTHELGHSIGLRHSGDPADVMYPTMRPGYAYCLVGPGALEGAPPAG